MLTQWTQIPYTDEIRLFETSLGGLSVPPQAIADRLGMTCDRGFDDLDSFDILIVDNGHLRLGFIRHSGSPVNHCGVCMFSNGSMADMKSALALSFPDLMDGFAEFDEPW
ncbi:MAG: hypothetical protein CMF75_08915 [Maricaulis sp.]|nr:hypothetical protein [Maricaulis sp.]